MQHNDMHIVNLRRLLVPLLLLCGCAARFEPVPAAQVPFLERAQTQEQNGVAVTAAVPSAEETRQLFGASLYSRGVQPVWIEISNSSDGDVAFFPLAVDAEYFTPIEAATVFSNRKMAGEMAQFFFQSGVDTRIVPGQTRAGFMFTNLDEGTKAFNVDLIGEDDSWQYTFFIPVPGLKLDHHAVDLQSLYPAADVDLFENAAEFVSALQALPCCTTDAKAQGSGDPLNIVVIGEPRELYYAFIRAGWDETEAISTASTMKTIASFISGGEYRYSPVSNLYVFDRPQDVAFQKIRLNINERNHLRLWLAPMRFRDQPVWIGQISRDIGVRFTSKTITTHKIDPDVDETREYLLENLAYNQALARFGYVDGVGAAPLSEPRGNLTGDPYFTDGRRVVLWVSPEPLEFEDIEVETWQPAQEESEGTATAAIRTVR